MKKQYKFSINVLRSVAAVACVTQIIAAIFLGRITTPVAGWSTGIFMVAVICISIYRLCRKTLLESAISARKHANVLRAIRHSKCENALACDEMENELWENRMADYSETLDETLLHLKRLDEQPKTSQ